MENAEEIYHYLEEFSKRKPKTIPQELNEYLAYVARTGDPVYQWPLVKSLFKEKLLSVITDFYETTPGIDIPPYPNVDPFNYDTMKNSLIERLDSFTSAPFTVQRICELLTYPRKQYNRVDKFMRAIEKNILVVSTREPGMQRHPEPENGENAEPLVNGSDNSDYNVDVEMEEMSWKENKDQKNTEPQPGSSDAHISVDDDTRKTEEDSPMEPQVKNATEEEPGTPPDVNIMTTETVQQKDKDKSSEVKSEADEPKMEITPSTAAETQPVPVEASADTPSSNVTLIIPEIKVDDAEMTEQKLNEQAMTSVKEDETTPSESLSQPENKTEIESPPITSADDSSSDSKDEPVTKHLSEVLTSSEESSSSSDNTDGNSNSPKPERQIDTQEDSSQSDSNKEDSQEINQDEKPKVEKKDTPKVSLESDNYSISDVNSELPQPKDASPKQESEAEKDDLTTNETDKKTVEDTEPTETKES